MGGYPGHWHQQGSNNVGGHVATIQAQLNRRGYSLAVDGVFGPNTTYSVRTFQASRGLLVDGIVGPATWAAL